MAFPKITEIIQQAGLLSSKIGAKKLGQNFLCNIDITDKICRLAGDIKDKVVLEIGPGPGGLSQSILKCNPQKLILIEKDPACVEILENVFSATPQVQIIKGDFLKADIQKISGSKIIANLPYNLSSVILLKFIRNQDRFEDLTLMFQKEFAMRLVAKPDTKQYGRLSIITQLFYEPKIVYTLPPSVFMPAPKVDSCVVTFKPKKNISNININLLEKVTHILFSKRRKTIRKSLKGSNIKAPPTIDLNKRPENLPPHEFLDFYEEKADTMDI